MSPDNNNPATSGYDEPQTGGSILPSEAERRLKEDASALAETAKHEAGAVAEQAKHEIGKAAEKAKGMATEQKEFIAHQVEDVAVAVSKVAGELENNNPTIGGYARTLADTVTNFSDTIRNKDVDELLDMAQDFGRRQPAAFMGAMALMGFAASRFLTASARRSHMPATMQDQYAATGVGDGGISGNYPGPSRRRAGEATRSPGDSMGGSI